MPLSRIVIGLVLAVGTTCAASADERRPVREARSENSRFLLRVRPGHPGRTEGGRCTGMLFERNAEPRRRRAVWDAPLANEVAPLRAFVRNDGRFVVTLDEYRRGGAAHATVIYNNQGENVREFGLRELLIASDWPHVRAEKREIVWLEGARFAFDDGAGQFVITLRWGREIRIDLEKLVIVGRERGGSQGEQPHAETQPDGQIPAEILALLASANQQTESDAAATGESGKEAATTQPSADSHVAVADALAEIARLRALTGEGGDRAQSQPTSEAAADARSEARDADDQLSEIRKADSHAVSDGVPEERRLTPDDEAFLGELLARIGAEPPMAGISGEVGAAVPPGDPAAHVDYVGWINEYTLTEGPSAAPFYTAASEATVHNELGSDLLGAALAGDADALSDPAVIAWIEANQQALEHLREAAQYEFNGQELHSADGMLLSVLLPSLRNLRELGRVSVAQGKLLELQDRPGEAIDSYLDAMTAGSDTGRGVTIIEDLLGVAVQDLAADALLDAYAADVDNRLDYAALTERVEATDRDPRPMYQTVQFERAMVHDVLQRVYEVNPESGAYQVSGEGLAMYLNAVGVLGDDPVDEIAAAFALGETGYERTIEDVDYYYDELTEAMRSPYPVAREHMGELEVALQTPEFKAQNPVVTQLIPSLSRAYTLETRGRATRRATTLVTHLRAYRQQFGSYPDSLEVFGDAEFAFDPFTDQPFAYRREGGDFVLYSLGNNGVDDGGVHDRRAMENDLRYWPRPPREE